MRFDCDQRSVSGFLSHLDSLDWYIDSYLSRSSFQMRRCRRTWLMGWRNHCPCPMRVFFNVFVHIQWSIMIQCDGLILRFLLAWSASYYQCELKFVLTHSCFRYERWLILSYTKNPTMSCLLTFKLFHFRSQERSCCVYSQWVIHLTHSYLPFQTRKKWVEVEMANTALSVFLFLRGMLALKTFFFFLSHVS